MRVPIPVTVFAVAAAVGAAIVVGPRAFSADEATAGAPPRVSESRATATAGPRQSETPGSRAHVLPGDATVVLRNKAAGECLRSDTRGEVFLHSCNGAAAEQWGVTDNGDGTRLFRNTATRQCLENRQRTGGTPVFTAACDGNVFQKWFFITDDDNLVSFQNDTTRLCLWDSPRPATAVPCVKSRLGGWWAVAVA